jgi:hypothetical protein
VLKSTADAPLKSSVPAIVTAPLASHVTALFRSLEPFRRMVTPAGMLMVVK